MSSSENHEVKSNGTIQIANENSLLPHLETIDRLLSLPMVNSAWCQSQGMYGKVKEYNPTLNWAFRTAEDVVKSAVTFSAPIVNAFDAPINYVDQTIVKGIDKLEAKAPIIKEQPTEIINQAKTKVLDAVQPRINQVYELRKAGEQKAASLKELSYNKANEVLATHYGSLAVSGVDTTVSIAERLLDSFFPKTQDDEEEDDDKPISASEDPALHTVQTIGALSNKVARRVYRSVSRQLKTIKKEDVYEYAASLIAVLRLTQYLNFLNRQQSTEKQQVQKPNEQSVAKALTLETK